MKHITRKKIASLIVLVSAVIVSLAILASPEEDAGVHIGGPDANIEKGIPSLGFESGDLKSALGLRPSLETRAKPNVEGNFTDLVAESLVREIIKRNPEGVEGLEKGGALNVPSLQSLDLSGTLSQESVLKGVATNYFQEEDIIVSDDSSPEAQIIYLDKFGGITEKNFEGFNKSIVDIVDAWMVNQDPRGIEKYLAIATAQMNDLLSLEAPSLWQTLHLQNLNLWHKKHLVFSAILDLENDPLKTMVALQTVPDVLRESTDIQTIINDRIVELAENL